VTSGAVFKDNQSSLDWQANDTFNFAIKSTTATKYNVTMVVSVRVAINKKKSDGTAGDFIKWSPTKSVTITRDVWLVGIKEIKVKPKGAGDSAYIVAPIEVVLLVGAECTFKAYKDPENASRCPNGMPISKLAGVASNGDVSDAFASVTGSVIQSFECGNWEFAAVTSVKPELLSVDFKNGGVQTITGVGITPEWVKANASGQGARNEPFCAVKNLPFNVSAVLSAPKNLTFPTSVKICEGMNKTQAAVDCTLQNWASVVTLTRNSPNAVALGTSNFNWHYTVDNGQNWHKFGESTHISYTTWGTKLCPESDFTKSHIHYACTTANGATTLAQIGDMIGPNATGSGRFDLQNNHALTPWLIIDTTPNLKSDCVSLCTLMKSAIQLLGDNSAEVWFVYACSNSWNNLANTSSYANEICVAHGHELGFWNGGNNRYERCCRFQGKWWMGGIGISKPHPIEVLRSVTSPNTVNGHTSGSTHHQCLDCFHPMPYPASTGGIIPPLNNTTNPPSYPSAIPNF
jgi:hypothetical protein